MKKTTEYLEKLYITQDGEPKSVHDSVENILDVFKQIQIDAIEETCRVCAENAEIEERDYRKNPTKVENYGQEVSSEYEGIYYGVDAESILNCAEILKKEIE